MKPPYDSNDLFRRHQKDLEQLVVSVETDGLAAFNLLAALYHAATTDRRMARMVLLADNSVGKVAAHLERQLGITPEMQRLIQDAHDGAALAGCQSSQHNPTQPPSRQLKRRH